MEAETIKNHEIESREFTWKRKSELTQSYKSYADYAFPEKKNHHPRCENTADSVFVHQLMMNVNCPIGNVFCGSVLSIVLLLPRS